MKIRVIAPSSKCKDIDVIINKFINYMRIEGNEVYYNPKIHNGNILPFFASSKDYSLIDLKDSINDTESNILWALRGGYGCGNIVQSLTEIIPPTNKTVIGFSDITAMHILFNIYYDLPTIHAPVVTSFVQDNHDFTEIKNLLNGVQKSYDLYPVNDYAGKFDITSVLVGGNLTVIQSLIGTKVHPNFAGKVLFLEDVDERPYRIHRSLMHLKNSFVLKDVRAIILGEFAKCGDKIDKVLYDYVENELLIPVYRIKNIGHVRNNLPIVLGSRVDIKNSMLHVQSNFNYSGFN